MEVPGGTGGLGWGWSFGGGRHKRRHLSCPVVICVISTFQPWDRGWRADLYDDGWSSPSYIRQQIAFQTHLVDSKRIELCMYVRTQLNTYDHIDIEL